jgi:hypothetical protein
MVLITLNDTSIPALESRPPGTGKPEASVNPANMGCQHSRSFSGIGSNGSREITTSAVSERAVRTRTLEDLRPDGSGDRKHAATQASCSANRTKSWKPPKALIDHTLKCSLPVLIDTVPLMLGRSNSKDN